MDDEQLAAVALVDLSDKIATGEARHRTVGGPHDRGEHVELR
jgi:hypothetical protein